MRSDGSRGACVGDAAATPTVDVGSGMIVGVGGMATGVGVDAAFATVVGGLVDGTPGLGGAVGLVPCCVHANAIITKIEAQVNANRCTLVSVIYFPQRRCLIGK